MSAYLRNLLSKEPAGEDSTDANSQHPQQQQQYIQQQQPVKVPDPFSVHTQIKQNPSSILDLFDLLSMP